MNIQLYLPPVALHSNLLPSQIPNSVELHQMYAPGDSVARLPPWPCAAGPGAA